MEQGAEVVEAVEEVPDVGAAAALALTALVAALDLAAWWVAPVLVPLFLFGSLRRALRGS